MKFNRETSPFYSLLQQRARANQREGAAAQRAVAQSLAAKDLLRNEQADDMTTAFPYWEAGKTYKNGEVVTDPANGQNYIIVTDPEVIAQENQPPHGEGMLDVYRPVPKRLSDSTFIFVYGQNVFAGDVCLAADGIAWTAKKDMLPCTQPPAEGDEWEKGAV